MGLNIIAWHDRTTTNHRDMLNRFSAQGFRFLSLSVYGDRNDPRYAAVMIKRAILEDERHFDSLTAASWQQTFNDMASQGWGPYILTATGPSTDPVIAAVFHRINPIPLTRHGINAGQFQQINQQMMGQGSILQWADAYGTLNDIRYIAVWYPNRDNTTWNCDAFNDSFETYQRRFNALASGWTRPVHVAVTPSQGYLALFTDNEIGPWVSRHGMSSAGYQAQFNYWMGRGFVPVQVAAKGVGGSSRFAAIFVTREEILPRLFRSTGSTSVPSIDQKVEAIMKINQIRGAALAILRGPKLVYAKGYTWAEAGYPIVFPTTLFRQASVSKIFAAVAIYQLIRENILTLNSTMQNILQLTTPSGAPPTDPRFNNITIRQLLEHRSGLNPYVLWMDVQAAQAFNTPLPATTEQIARLCASLPLESNPGSTQTYNNMGYFMLSQVVTKLRSSSSFEEAIKPSLLIPLGITRLRESRSLVNVQTSEEARYHSRPLQTRSSVRTPEMPMIPLGYGEISLENIDGSGGLSASVIDVSRLLAALSLRSGQPILDQNSRLSMFNNAAADGGHGFDWLQVISAADNNYRGVKGGLLDTSANAFYFTAGGGFSYVICWNGLSPKGDSWYPVFQSILDAAMNHQWGNIDLFPEYGMNSLPIFETLIERKIDLDTMHVPASNIDPFKSPLQRSEETKI